MSAASCNNGGDSSFNKSLNTHTRSIQIKNEKNELGQNFELGEIMFRREWMINRKKTSWNWSSSHWKSGDGKEGRKQSEERRVSETYAGGRRWVGIEKGQWWVEFIYRANKLGFHTVYTKLFSTLQILGDDVA